MNKFCFIHFVVKSFLFCKTWIFSGTLNCQLCKTLLLTYIKTDEVFHCCILGPWWNLHFAIRCGFPGFQWFIDCKQFAFSPFECHWGSWAWSGEPIASKDYILLIWKFRIFNEKKIKKDRDKNHRYTISKNVTLCLTQWYCCPLGDVPQHLVILHWHVAENHFIIYA